MNAARSSGVLWEAYDPAGREAGSALADELTFRDPGAGRFSSERADGR